MTAAATCDMLAADEPAAVEIVNPDGAGRLVLTCDHASNRLPRRLGTLGLGPVALASHIAWDPGAAWVARRLSALLDAPLLLSGYSRLAIDCNRLPTSRDAIPAVSAGVDIPGNRNLSPAVAAARADALFWPYQRAIGALLDRRARLGQVGALLAIHSFTPDYPGEVRPWEICISYNRDRRLAAALLRAFATAGDLVVGDNQPYAVDDLSDYTIPAHGERRGLAHALIEIRQDLLPSEAAADGWAQRLAAAIGDAAPIIATGGSRPPSMSEGEMIR